MTPIEDLEARLAKMDDAFKSAPSENQGGFWLPDVGIYQTIFRSVDFFEAKTTGQAFLKLVFEITLNKEYAGREIEQVYNLEPQGSPDEIEMKLSFLKRDLKTLGVPVDEEDFSLAQVRPGSPLWNTILDIPVEIEVKQSKKINENTGKPFVNSYIQARLGDPLPAGMVPEGDIPNEPLPVPPVKDDDQEPIPF